LMTCGSFFVTVLKVLDLRNAVVHPEFVAPGDKFSFGIPTSLHSW